MGSVQSMQCVHWDTFLYLSSIQCIFQDLLLWEIKREMDQMSHHREPAVILQGTTVVLHCTGLGRDEKTHHCGPPPAPMQARVDDAVQSAPHGHLPKVTIHSLYINTAGGSHE